MKKCTISIYAFILPSLAGLAAFSSKDYSPDYQLTQVFSWLLLLFFGVIFLKNFKYRPFALLLFSATVSLRILSYIQTNHQYTQYLLLLFYAIIIIFSGSSVVLKKPVLLIKQMYWISLISIIMSLLQINGVLWAQEIGSQIARSDTFFLFQGYSADLWGDLNQTRPDGFTHANNLTSQLLMFFYAYSFYYFTFNNRFYKSPLRWQFAIAFACALTAGKVTILAIVSINIVTWLFFRRNNTKLLLRTFAITFTAYVLYFFLFPGLFILNFNYDLFVYNMMLRVFNIGILTGHPIFQSITGFLEGIYTGEYVGVENPIKYFAEIDPTITRSGISYLLNYLPGIFLTLLIAGLFFVKRLPRVDNLSLSNIRYLIYVILVALISSLFGGPFVRTVWFLFFFSFVTLPIILPYFSLRFRRSVSILPRRPAKCSLNLPTKSNTLVVYDS